MKIGVLSDTHGFLHPQTASFFAPCDQIWHAGDIGNIDVYTALQNMKPIQAVYGNIDGKDIRLKTKEYICFEVEHLKVLMMHIGGYPPKYNSHSIQLIKEYQPDIFVCGHSHILKVLYDEKHNLLAINPGAAGHYGFHQAITFLRFDILNGKPCNLEVFHEEKSL